MAIFAIQELLGVSVQELHGKVNAVQFSAFDWQVARVGCATAQDDRVVVFHDRVGSNVISDFAIGDEGNTFLAHQIYAPFDQLLLQLHVGDSIHQEAADAVRPLVNGDGMTRRVELRGTGEPCRPPEPTTATRFPVRTAGGCGMTQPSSKPRSMIAHSMLLMVTGGSIRPKVQEPSQALDRRVPVNSGKLLVA